MLTSSFPAWARNLPPEFPDDDYDDHAIASSTSGSHNTARRRSLTSLFRPPPSGSQPLAPKSTIVPIPPSSPHDANSEASTSTPLIERSPKKLRPPPLSFQASDVQRQHPPPTPGPPGGDKWWTFTLPSKYMDKVHEYVQNQSSQGMGEALEKSKSGAGASAADDDKRSRKSRDKDPEKEAQHKHMTMSARLPAGLFSVNQTETPGWSSPWQPFQRSSTDIRDPFHFSPDPATSGPRTRYQRLQDFALNNAFAPLVFRFMNLALTVCTLGLASNVRRQERHAQLVGVIGSSTLFLICVCPLAIVHVFVNVYVSPHWGLYDSS
ncbi:hypothetical protein P7C70_g2116, partial [Phenoliferia sp. Uapishka_3]